MRKPVAISWPGVAREFDALAENCLGTFGSRSTSVIASELRLMTMAPGIPDVAPTLTDSSTVGSISSAAVPPSSAQLTL